MNYIENDLCELKQELTDDVKKEIIAFLNTKGGTIYVGVTDDGVAVPQTDNKVRDKIDTTISGWIEEAFHPRPSNLIKHYFNSDNVMVIVIKEGSEKPYYLKGKRPKPSGVYKRLGRSCRQASEDEILSMIMDTKGYYFEKDVSEEQELTFKYFFSECEEQEISYQKRDLKSLGIINSNDQYTNLGLLLSDQSPIVVKFAKYDNNMNFLLKKEFKGSLLKVLHQTIENASSYNDISAVIDTKTFRGIETYSYPEVSLREGILNAFCHAGFFIRSNIKIEFFPTYLKITNPGGIYKATLEDIMSGIQTYRNPGLVNVFNKLKLIENFGTGIPRINNSYRDFVEKPLFKPSDNFFTLSLPNINTIGDPLSDPLNPNLSDFDLLVLKTIYNNPGLNTKKLLQFIILEDSTATVDKIKNSLKRHLKIIVSLRVTEATADTMLNKWKININFLI